MKRPGPIGEVDPAVRDVHVWGGGVAGLLMAHALGKRGHHVVLHERSDKLGGKIGTTQLPTGLAEHGPNAIYVDIAGRKLLRDLKLHPFYARPKLRRTVWREGAPRFPLPFSVLLTVLSNLFKRVQPPAPGTSLADFMRPFLGEEGVRMVLSPAMQGIYGTTAEQLSVGSVWPSLLNNCPARWWLLPAYLARGQGKPQSASFKGGMGEFIERLAASFPGEIKLNDRTPFELLPNTVVCTPAAEAAELLAPHWKEGAQQLERIPYLPVSSVTLHFREAPGFTARSFGVLFPRGERFNSLGCLCNHAIFRGRVGAGAQASLTFILPETSDPASLARQDAQRLGIKEPPMAEHVTPYHRGLPLYGHDRYRAVQALRDSPTRPKSLVLFGNYVAGISLRDMIHATASLTLALWLVPARADFTGANPAWRACPSPKDMCVMVGNICGAPHAINKAHQKPYDAYMKEWKPRVKCSPYSGPKMGTFKAVCQQGKCAVVPR